MRRISSVKNKAFSEPKYIRAFKNELLAHLRLSTDERRLRRAPIKESIFYESEICEAVYDKTLGKCVYCEQPVSMEQGVDHYRPLGNAQDMIGEPDNDSYTWLAYEYENLVSTCAECRFSKGNIFPVDGERAMYLTRMQDIHELERPMILNPYRDQISSHLQFLVNGICWPKSDRGKITVSVLNLNRQELVTKRAQNLELFLDELKNMILGSSEYSAYFHVFNQKSIFAGVRINVLQRILKGLQLGGSPIAIGASTIASTFESRTRHGILDPEAEILLQRIRDIPIEDDQNKFHDFGEAIYDSSRDTEGNMDAGPWRSVKRHGGISSISIRAFKGVQSLDFDIPSRTNSKTASCIMLLGENSVGKSSILQAIALALLGSSEVRRMKLKSREYLSSRLEGRWDQLTPDDAVATVRFHYDNASHFRLDASRDTCHGNDQVGAIVLGYGPRRYFDRENSAVSKFASTRVNTLFNPKATIPYPGVWLSELNAKEFEQVAQVMRTVLTLSESDRVIRDADGHICAELDGQSVPLELLSEGYKSVIAMIVDIMRELLPRFPVLRDAEAVVLIDEIETHLHPRWKMKIMTALRESLPQVQFIATTHDPLCLRGMDDGEVVVLQRTTGHSVQQLEGLPSVKGMRADQLLTSDFFGLSSTVDPDTELNLARYIRDLDIEPSGTITNDQDLIGQITIGNSAQEQIIRKAMRHYSEERESPQKRSRTEISKDAVKAVLEALRDRRKNDFDQ